MAVPKVSKEAIYLLLATFYLVAMGLLDWDYFFPLQAHTDLGFQVAGEALELLVLSGSLGVVFWSSKVIGRDLSVRRPTLAQRFPTGCAMAIFFIAPSWRDFFPGDNFHYAAGAHHIIGAVIGGAFFGAFVPLTFKRTDEAKPVEENVMPIV